MPVVVDLVFVTVAQYISMCKWASNVVRPALHKNVSLPWYVRVSPNSNTRVLALILGLVCLFTAFQVVSAYQPGHVARGPVYGSIPTSISYDCIHDSPDSGWQYCIRMFGLPILNFR